MTRGKHRDLPCGSRERGRLRTAVESQGSIRSGYVSLEKAPSRLEKGSRHLRGAVSASMASDKRSSEKKKTGTTNNGFWIKIYRF